MEAIKAGTKVIILFFFVLFLEKNYPMCQDFSQKVFNCLIISRSTNSTANLLLTSLSILLLISLEQSLEMLLFFLI